MKKYFALILLFNSYLLSAQIFVQDSIGGSVTITPNGLRGKTDTHISNVALGSNALKNTTIQNHPYGRYNIAIGDSSMFANSTGHINTAVGVLSMQKNTTGLANTATGAYALRENTEGSHNTGIGNLSLYANITGIRNTALGNATLYYNTIGSYNTAVGNQALFKANGSQNTALGNYSLREATSGQYNTAAGAHAGKKITKGSNNTFLGFSADAEVDSLNNAMAIGAFAIVDTSNKVRIGDNQVTVIEGQVAWSNPSDRRLKESIVYTDRLGLDFIKELQTVSYNYIADENKTRYDGFIAQDIEALMQKYDIPFSGLKKSGNGMLSLAYSDFVMPLVNAVKEQQKQIEALKKELAKTNDINSRLEQLEALLME